jgi:hypothetical protein
MNGYFKSLVVLLILRMMLFQVFAGTSNAQPHIPASLWQSQAGVIDFAITLITLEEKEKSESMIKVYIKNTSTSDQALVVSSHTDRGFTFFTIDGNGAKHLLHGHPPLKEPSDGMSLQELAQLRLQEALANSGSAHLEQIAPGETIFRTIGITPADLALIKSCLIQCTFSIVNPTTSQQYPIESSPQKLTETFEATTTK